MRAKLSFMIAVTVLFAFASLSLAAAKTVTQKGRSVYHMVKVDVVQVGDVPGHIVGVADARGLTFVENGDVGTYLNRIMFDYVNGSGPHWGYGVTTFPDGSTTVIKYEGTTTAQEGGASSFKGAYTYIGGTGRFEGIQGRGSYTGKRAAPMTPGAPADSYSDSIETYTLPSQ
jgi:hypothetical protein